jgi:tetratricopeptide (TPR) repeat protein
LDVVEKDRGRYGQRALALLADNEFEAGQLREASAHYDLIEQRYPDSEAAWAAAMRVAQISQSLGGSETAAKVFARIGSIYAGKPSVPAMASFYEARAYEVTARWAEALRAYRTAYDTWPAREDEWYGLNWKVLYFADPFVTSLWPASISRSEVASRIAALTRAVSSRVTSDVEHATWLLNHDRPSEARDVLLRIEKATQGSTSGISFQSLLHRAEVDTAISTMSGKGVLPRRAMNTLERLCSEPFDTWSAVGCAIHASAVAVAGNREAAESGLRMILGKWVEAQRSTQERSPTEENIARDAMAIRDLLFEPDSPDGLRGFDGFQEPARVYASPSFIFLPSQLRVTTAEGTQSYDLEAVTPRGRSNVILLPSREARKLWNSIELLSNCDQQGTRSQRLNQLWHSVIGFAPVYCTVGGSWYTAPTVGPVHFTDPERTRAHVVMTTGKYANGGRAVIVEKMDGEWKVTGSAGVWEH